jgi:hypothetical protein
MEAKWNPSGGERIDVEEERHLGRRDVKKTTLLAILLGLAGVFVALAWPGAGRRGIAAEEVQPHLHRYPIVLTRAERGAHPEPDDPPSSGSAGRYDGQTAQEGPRPPSIVRMRPYEEGAPGRPRWVATSQWPVIAYDGESRMWPVLLRGPETALGSYIPIALGPILGGGIPGVRRSTVLLGLCVVLLTGLVAARMRRRANASPGPGDRAGTADPSPGDVTTIVGATALVAGSFGMVALARAGHTSEVAGLAAMMLALAGLAYREPPTVRRAAWVGLACAVAILCRATLVIVIVPAILVFCFSRDRIPGRRAAVTLAVLGLVLPVLLAALLVLAAPFPPGNGLLSGFPLERIPARMLVIHRQLVLTLAWLGDATSILGPLTRGETSDGPLSWRAAAIGGAPLVAACVRLARGRAGMGEKLFLATLASSVLAGALLDSEGPNASHLAPGLEPFFALALAEQLAAIVGSSREAALQGMSRQARAYRVRAWALGAAVVLLRIASMHDGLGLDARTANPMLSGKAQQAAATRMKDPDINGPEVVTTAYHHVGVIEGWTEGRIQPVHAWPVLESPEDASDCPLQASWREIFRVYRPHYVLLTEGPSLHESSGNHPQAIVRSLRRAAEIAGVRVDSDSSFPTESGGPGWALVSLRYPRSLLAPGRDELAVDPACRDASTEPVGEPLPSFEGLSPGLRVGAMQIEGFERRDGVIRITARRKRDVAVFEVRPEGDGPPPPASGGGYGVYYRNTDTRDFESNELVAAATAIAAELARARPPAAPR